MKTLPQQLFFLGKIPPNTADFFYNLSKVEFKLVQAWPGRRKQVRGRHSPSSIQGEWLTINDQKNSYLAANWLQKLETKHCVYDAEVISVLMRVCGSQFDLSITKQNYLFVRCQSLSHISNTSLRCSNQPLWKLNLMTGVNTTKKR